MQAQTANPPLYDILPLFSMLAALLLHRPHALPDDPLRRGYRTCHTVTPIWPASTDVTNVTISNFCDIHADTKSVSHCDAYLAS